MGSAHRLTALCAGLALGACDGAEPAAPPPPPAPAAEYVGSETCGGCHAAALAAWRGSHHDLAMQPATPDTLLGDFDDARFSSGRRQVRFFRRGGTAFVEDEGPDGARGAFAVAHAFGIHPLQQLLLPLPGGRLQAFDVAWDVEAGRWFEIAPDPARKPGDPFHWSGRYQRWNAMCADCHATGLERGYDPVSDGYGTTWAEPDVGCEACHGPGSHHVARARGGHEAPPPVPLTAGDARSEVETCAPCHSRRRRITDAPAPARPFFDHYAPRSLAPDLYHPDGQVLEEVYVYGSFVQTPMYRAGVRCSDCHEPHGLALRAPGDAVCATCHGPEPSPRFPQLPARRYDTPAHHFHPPESAGARCVACHMPASLFMGIDARRDHSIRPPRPDLTLSLGIPNACGRCHGDRGPQWAAARAAQWWGPPDGSDDFAPILAAARAGDPGAGPALAALAGDERRAPIVRATALEALVPWGPAAGPVWAEATRDPHPWVRAAAVAGLAALPVPQRITPAASLLRDPVRLVRIEAARSLAAVPPDRLGPAQRRALDAGLRELEAAERARADFPEAHLNLALLHEARGRRARAERAYRTALALDADFLPARANLVQLLHAMGRSEEAEALLREGLARSPEGAERGELAYSLGLLLAEVGRSEAAAASLGEAAQLMPGRSRVHYNHGLALQKVGREAAARAALERARELDPEDPDVARALSALAPPGARYPSP